MKKQFLYEVVLVKATSYESLFENIDKDKCKEFKRENKALGKLAIKVKDVKYI